MRIFVVSVHRTAGQAGDWILSGDLPPATHTPLESLWPGEMGFQGPCPEGQRAPPGRAPSRPARAVTFTYTGLGLKHELGKELGDLGTLAVEGSSQVEEIQRAPGSVGGTGVQGHTLSPEWGGAAQRGTDRK